MKPEVIIKVARDKYQHGEGPAGCYKVVPIYFKKPSPSGDTAMQCSSVSTHHQAKTHRVTKPSADLCIAKQRILYIKTNSQLLHNMILNINTWKHSLTHCLFPFGHTFCPANSITRATQSVGRNIVPIRKDKFRKHHFCLAHPHSLAAFLSSLLLWQWHRLSILGTFTALETLLIIVEKHSG